MNELARKPEPLTVLREDRDHRIGVFGPLLLTAWFGETRVLALQEMERLMRASVPRAPESRVGLVVVVEPGATLPDGAAREELSRIRRTNPIALTALIHEGTGFQAALVRGITMSLNLLEPPETRTHVFADAAGAVKWLDEHHPRYGGGSALEAALREFRAQSGVARPTG